MDWDKREELICRDRKCGIDVVYGVWLGAERFYRSAEESIAFVCRF